VQDVATQVLIEEMAVELEQMQSQPEDWSQDAPSHEPMQSFHEQEGSQPWATVTPARAAMAKDFILILCYMYVQDRRTIMIRERLYGCRAEKVKSCVVDESETSTGNSRQSDI